MAALALNPPHPAVTPLARFASQAFVVLFLLTSLQAYNLGPLPLDWLAQFGFVGLALMLVTLGRPVALPELRPFAMFTLWAVLVTGLASAGRDYAAMMPDGATTPYPMFMGLRLMMLASFFSAAYVVAWLVRYKDSDRLTRAIVGVGVAVSLVALYIYAAPSLGLPEPPRTRMGTGGKEQATQFAYAFHRALGTFREPSHLAAWLTLPFFLSLRNRNRLPSLATLLMSLTLLLTGSLAGIGATVLGFLGAAVLFGWRRFAGARLALKLAAVLGLGVLAFGLVVGVASTRKGDLIQVVVGRAAPILEEGGFESTNRAYSYHYLEETEVPFLGKGMGNAQIELGRDLGFGLMGNFANLFFATYVGTGVIGLALLIFALATPVLNAFHRQGGADAQGLVVGASAYLACIVLGFVLYDELGVLFGMAAGFLITATRPREVRQS